MRSPLPAHRPSSRGDILASTLALARGGATISLESAARAAGVTKPGLMYHFPTKEVLMVAVVDHLMDSYEDALGRRLPAADRGEPTLQARLLAYLDWICDGHFDSGDLVMFADPRLRERLAATWNERLGALVGIPADAPPERRARLHGVRLIADGLWFNAAAGGLPLSERDRAEVRELGHRLVEERS
ncbi:TetR/AcrR family transcriptional regulator [Agilicoccus flavus]|uniref:TetR/AcrR family transcriptional regulator n=1 Tax=Agilicoccus flavus TaxID=2775968 RepID=UPI001CF65FB3|nr:TetR/AcrR family transcriptional regulator [Agilicoccus flavus]